MAPPPTGAATHARTIFDQPRPEVPMTQQRRAFGHNGSIRDDTRELGRSLLRSGRARSRPTVASRGEAAAHGVGPPAACVRAALHRGWDPAMFPPDNIIVSRRACGPPFIEAATPTWPGTRRISTSRHTCAPPFIEAGRPRADRSAECRRGARAHRDCQRQAAGQLCDLGVGDAGCTKPDHDCRAVGQVYGAEQRG